MSIMDDGDVSRLLLFKTDHTPIETQFFNQMMDLEEYGLLNVSMPSYPCGRLEIQLVGAIETKFKNTKDLKTKNYKGMTESPHKNKFTKRIDVEHKIFVKFECLKETLKRDLRPDEKVIAST